MTAFISRSEWQARPSNGAGNALNGKPKGVAVHYEGPKMGSRTHDKCAALVRSIQRFHQVSRGWADVAYNLLVCEHGFVYEGRGAKRASAANGSTKANEDYFAVCALVGEGDVVTDALKEGINDAIVYLRKEGGAGSEVVCHSDLFATACPGDALRAWVRAGTPRPSLAGRARVKVSRTVARRKPSSVGVKVPAFPGYVRKGSRGATVTKVQYRLKARGWRIAVDGIFGGDTDAVVRAFQKEKGLTPDGIVGPQTWRALWTATVTA